MPKLRTQERTRRRLGRWIPLGLVLVLLLVLAPALARAQAPDTASVTLAWTSPGDDANVGTATTYDVRMSTAPISAGNFDAATALGGLPTPLSAGTRQTARVSGLTRGTTYYFAIKTVDDVGNWSGISNVVRFDWVIDSAPPGTPSGVSVTRQGADARVQWAANSEPDLAGYRVYRATTQNGSYTRLNNNLIVATQFTDNSVPVGGSEVWYKVTALDATGNESARSTGAVLSLTGEGASAEWRIDPAYPNPGRVGGSVNVPVYVAGGGSAELMVTDAARRIVRRYDLGSMPAGPQTVVWDGRNDAGRPVVPGVYTAWIIAGGTRRNVRVVLVP
ncbi:MAG: hypothetical protein HOP12_00435 [Candidatus Eisenbacteria bacterium]|uniref:Fibronectin type-III domain-containing protein n=1 Tax=Eiseniibacteriota bacterium TaxID=2212470 RepID=A0A849SAC2_UNCEI|nr:hypothetical protein [Candidatus Eisenbacteria bacterium]